MRAYEFITEADFGRMPYLSQKLRRQQREREQKLAAEERRKAPLRSLMYDTGRRHEQAMQAIELAAAKLDLERQLRELNDQYQESDDDSQRRIKELARRTRKRQIKV